MDSGDDYLKVLFCCCKKGDVQLLENEVMGRSLMTLMEPLLVNYTFNFFRFNTLCPVEGIAENHQPSSRKGRNEKNPFCSQPSKQEIVKL